MTIFTVSNQFPLRPVFEETSYPVVCSTTVHLPQNVSFNGEKGGVVIMGEQFKNTHGTHVHFRKVQVVSFIEHSLTVLVHSWSTTYHIT